jgi:hypothetical protein
MGFFSSPPHPDRLCGPPSILFSGYQGLFPWGQSGRGVKLTTCLHLLTRIIMHGVIPPLSQYAFMVWCLVEHGQIYLYLSQRTWSFSKIQPKIFRSGSDWTSGQKIVRSDLLIKTLKYTRVCPKVSGLAAWSENCKWYNSLPLGTVVSLFCESV